jgi:hypothetical protein
MTRTASKRSDALLKQLAQEPALPGLQRGAPWGQERSDWGAS